MFKVAREEQKVASLKLNVQCCMFKVSREEKN